MLRVLVVAGFLSFVVGTSAAIAAGQDRIATVKSLHGDALILRGEVTLPATLGMPLHQKDRLMTKAGSSMSVILLDDTTLSLGPNSELDLKQYEFNPEAGQFSFVTRMIKGTFIYLSGLMGKLAPESIRLETPDSTIAVRGTRLLVKVTP